MMFPDTVKGGGGLAMIHVREYSEEQAGVVRGTKNSLHTPANKDPSYFPNESRSDLQPFSFARFFTLQCKVRESTTNGGTIHHTTRTCCIN
mmetsp:Transcript_57380/g.117476  ORF Transcript_57380/g.117476 Transcript_57380/m.117476 type:complete len:91 (-) Transcript_57380:190-462(-)